MLGAYDIILPLNEGDGIEVLLHSGIHRQGKIDQFDESNGVISYTATVNGDRLFFNCAPSQVLQVFECCKTCCRDFENCICKEPEVENEFNTPCLNDSQRNPSMVSNSHRW